MGRSHGHHRYRRRLQCPECGAGEFFQTQDSVGHYHHTCVECFTLDGLVVEPVTVLESLNVPRTRMARLWGNPHAPLRTKRSR